MLSIIGINIGIRLATKEGAKMLWKFTEGAYKYMGMRLCILFAFKDEKQEPCVGV